MSIIDADELDSLRLELETAQRQNAGLRQWVADLQSGMYINCVYCGHRYGPDHETPVAMADVLKDHIARCPEHPMSKLRAEYDVLLGNYRVLERVVKQYSGIGDAVCRCR